MVWAWKAKFRYFYQPLAPEVAILPEKCVSGAQKCTFQPQMRLLGPRRKTLYKHKVLGGVLEAQNRESALYAQKVRNPARRPDLHHKSWFLCKKCTFRESAGKSIWHYLFCFKRMINNKIAWNGGSGPQNREIPQVPVKMVELLDFYKNSEI